MLKYYMVIIMVKLKDNSKIEPKNRTKKITKSFHNSNVLFSGINQNKFKDLNNINITLKEYSNTLNKNNEYILEQIDTIKRAQLFINESMQHLNDIPKNILIALGNASFQVNKLSNIQQMCLLKFIPSIDEHIYKKKMKQISKNDAKIMFEMNINYDVERNRFLKNDKVVSLKLIKQCARSSDFFDEISADELLSLAQHLCEYPQLGSEHPVGKEILNICKKLKNEYLKEISPMVLYRARIKEKEDLGFLEEEMRKAPFGISSQGRFNETGRGTFYLTDSIEASCTEVRKHNSTVAQIQIGKFKNKSSVYVLDIRGWTNDFAKFCSTPSSNDKKISKEYLISNYFGTCLKMCEINGILYKNKEGNNLYAFFDDKLFDYEGSQFK